MQQEVMIASVQGTFEDELKLDIASLLAAFLSPLQRASSGHGWKRQNADTGDDVNTQSQRVETGWSSCLMLGRGVHNPSLSKKDGTHRVTENCPSGVSAK